MEEDRLCLCVPCDLRDPLSGQETGDSSMQAGASVMSQRRA